MSSKQIAKLVFKGISFGANRIPDSWFEKVPGGYYSKREEEINNFERSRGYATPASTRAKKQARRRARRAYSNDVTDSESDWSSEEDYLTDDSERRPSRHHRNSSKRHHGSRSVDRDRAYRHKRAQSMPTTPPLGPYPSNGYNGYYGSPQAPMQPQYPPQQPQYPPQYPQQQPQYPPQQPQQAPPQGDFPAQRPYNPADYAMIPADGTTVQDPYAYHAARAAPDDYSTSNWVNTGHPASPAMGAAVPPQNMPQDPRAMSPPMMPYATPPYGSAGSYEFPPQTQAIGYSPQGSLNGAPIARSASAREPRSRSRRDKQVRMKSNSPVTDRLQNYHGEGKKDNKKKKLGTPALGAVTGGLVASEVGNAGGLGTLAGAAIGGVALHLYERRRSKSRARESPAPTNGSPEDPAVHYERQRVLDHQMRQEKRRRRREREAYGREQDGYQSY